MRLNIVKSKNAEQLYIIKSYRQKNGKNTSKIVAKLGNMDSLLPLHNNSRDEVILWAKQEAERLTVLEKEENDKILIELSQSSLIRPDVQTHYNGGYLFLQDIFYDLKLDKMCSIISKNFSFRYDLASVLSRLIYSRIIYPSSKLATFEHSKSFIEQPDFKLHDIYRSLDVIEKENDFIQQFVYDSSLNVVKRNSSILFYDCTNFFFELENAEGLKQYGKSKENRPNPIVQMGLFMDGDGLPLSFIITPGNQSEQTTLKPLESRIIRDFQLSRFIVCTDAGLASKENRDFNNMGQRSYIVTQSLKKLKQPIKEWTLSPHGWHLADSDTIYDIEEVIEKVNKGDMDGINTEYIWYKDTYPYEDRPEERLIVSYSPKYALYQKKIREGQIERAKKLAQEGKKSSHNNPNSPSRFILEINTTESGEAASEKHLAIDETKIVQEAMFDGFYGVTTTLKDPIEEIIKINKRRWEIEETFRIMKSEFRTRPVYLQNDERITAHFTICFLSMLISRILEKKLKESYSAEKIIDTLRSMDFQYYQGKGYIPIYTRTEITDALHNAFDFRTDTQIVGEQKMKSIIKKTKK